MKRAQYIKHWNDNDSHESNCAIREITSAECTCGKADYLSLRDSFIEDEMYNAVDAGCFDSISDPECRAYAERVWMRQRDRRVLEAGAGDALVF